MFAGLTPVMAMSNARLYQSAWCSLKIFETA